MRQIIDSINCNNRLNTLLASDYQFARLPRLHQIMDIDNLVIRYSPATLDHGAFDSYFLFTITIS